MTKLAFDLSKKQDHENSSGNSCDNDHDRFEEAGVDQKSPIFTIERDCAKEWHKPGEQSGDEPAAPGRPGDGDHAVLQPGIVFFFGERY